MDNNTKEVVNAFTTSGVVGKVLIVFMIIFVIFFVWDKVDNNRSFQEYVKQGETLQVLVKNQAQVEAIKKCVNLAVDSAISEFNKNFIPQLGKTLQDSGIPFPQDLNMSILNVRQDFLEVKNCLIFPKKE